MNKIIKIMKLMCLVFYYMLVFFAYCYLGFPKDFTLYNNLFFGFCCLMVDLITYRTVLLFNEISSTLNALNKSLYDFSCSIVQTDDRDFYDILGSRGSI
ncbi:unnamed protein product [Leptidea sinapis]|uniref:Gustatory receptor n=1 Tax=Leptidea sinapis TaxID=189913 RepID=A0A5E4QJF7_9NEOP|nr:unnamed protein product [Leptidea sinapis]